MVQGQYQFHLLPSTRARILKMMYPEALKSKPIPVMFGIDDPGQSLACLSQLSAVRVRRMGAPSQTLSRVLYSKESPSICHIRTHFWLMVCYACEAFLGADDRCYPLPLSETAPGQTSRSILFGSRTEFHIAEFEASLGSNNSFSPCPEQAQTLTAPCHAAFFHNKAWTHLWRYFS